MVVLPSSIRLDNRPETFPSTPQFRVSLVRENIPLAPVAPAFVKNDPIQLASLPIVPDKPPAALGRIVARQSVNYPRVVKILGRGPARNQYGASCVAYARSQGFNVSGNAITWPARARAAGYRVDHSIEIGAILVTRESSAGTSTGHVTGKVQKIENGFAYVTEQNYRAGMLTAGWVPLTRVVNAIHLQ